jgi:bifunctional UDP-N-acetylglucosamine pyrophosphorylase/glucosamine-1-phosphate N-acetyltransferase
MVHSHSIIQRCITGEHVNIGPFARLRDNSLIGDNAEIGNFVEMKDSTVGAGSKTRHLSYISNTHIGTNVKTGPGLITCNFDGTQSNQTTIEDNAFIEGNNTLIAPLNIGKGAYIAAGTTINQDVPQAPFPQTTPLTETEQQSVAKEHEDERKESAFKFTGAIKTKHDQRAEF